MNMTGVDMTIKEMLTAGINRINMLADERESDRDKILDDVDDELTKS